MSVLGLIPLAGALLNGLLSLFVIACERRSRLNQVFFLWGLCITVWNAGTFFLFKCTDRETALLAARIMQFGVIFIPVTLFHVSLLLTAYTKRWPIVVTYAFGITLALTNFTDFFISDVRFVGYAWYSVAGPGFWIFTALFSLSGVAIYLLIRRRQALPVHRRKQLTGLIIAQTTLVTLGTNDMLPILRIDQYPGTSITVFPYGSLAAVFYGVVVGYCVLQHQLLNVHVALGRLAAHVVRYIFLLMIGLTLQFILVLVQPKQFPNYAFFGSLGVLLGATYIASLLFPRLLGNQSEALERRLLGDHFEYQDQVRNFIQGMTWYGDMDVLLNELHALLTRTLKSESYKIILRDETTYAFALVRAFPDEPSRQLADLKPTSAVFQYFEWGEGEYLSLSNHHVRGSSSRMAREARDQMAPFRAEFCFPLAWQNEPFGLLLVGPKSSSEHYTATDISLFVSLAKNMSTVANQIRLKTQIMHAQELDLLGRMSRGMAHDLNNLLTPVSTLLQLQEETGILEEELIPVAARNVATMRTYIKEALFFSENLRPDLQLARLDLAVIRAVEVARNARQKQVNVRPVLPGEVSVEMDAVLVQRLIANLVTNAIDASPPGSQVLVVLELLARSDQRDWLRIRVIDEGEGISKENLDHVLTPYFTTKNHGDATRGFGLGLSICRKIATLHGGNLSIESRLKKGTTVQLDLPSRQLQQPALPPLAPASLVATT